MSPRDKFDRYMVAFGAARHIKFRRLNTVERHAFFLGVLSIAGQAPVRGCLLVGELPAEAADVAQEADVHVKFATSALEKLRQVGVIYTDDELGCERVHDFEDWNPAPKVDATNAERQRRYQAKLKASRNGVTNGTANGAHAVTNGLAREEVEVEVPPIAPQGATVDFEEWAEHYQLTTGHTLPRRGTKAFHAIAEHYSARRNEGYAAEDLKLATVGAHADDYRRANGYDTAESILRPTKVAKLVAQGRLRTGGRNGAKTSMDLAREFNGGAA